MKEKKKKERRKEKKENTLPISKLVKNSNLQLDVKYKLINPIHKVWSQYIFLVQENIQVI